MTMRKAFLCHHLDHHPHLPHRRNKTDETITTTMTMTTNHQRTTAVLALALALVLGGFEAYEHSCEGYSEGRYLVMG